MKERMKERKKGKMNERKDERKEKCQPLSQHFGRDIKNAPSKNAL